MEQIILNYSAKAKLTSATTLSNPCFDFEFFGSQVGLT